MPNRREFLQSSAVVTAFAANGLTRDASAIGAARVRVDLYKTIYDDRYAEARSFAAAVAARGVAVGALERGDVTRWYEALDLEWRTSPVAIAGVTQFGPMFVLERLGAERGLRIALRVVHRPQADGTLRHEVSADAHTVALARTLIETGVEWPQLIAALICAGGGPDVTGRMEAALVGEGAVPRLERSATDEAAVQPSIIHYYTPRAVQQGYGEALDGPLFSWLLVPRSA